MIRSLPCARSARCTSSMAKWSIWRRRRAWWPPLTPTLEENEPVFSYYITLALRSLKRNVVLTALMIAAIGVGIGASMTTLTVFRAMASDPIPQKSAQLFEPQIDNWGPQKQGEVTGESGSLPEQVSYTDAMAWINAHAARRQTAMYATSLALTPSNPDVRPFQVPARATFTDFFPMFDVPFLFGGPW